MVFKKPIYHIPGFRIIPGYIDYCINIKGEIRKVSDNRLVNIYRDPLGYKVVAINDPDKSCCKTTRHHRLLCLAWLPNTDYLTRAYINHIDGDKGNNKLENLEWCSDYENSNHARGIGLNNQQINIKIRDAFTGEIKHFNTLNSLNKYLGAPHGHLSMNRINLARLPGYLYKKRYEIKMANDDTPWYYDNPDLHSINTGKNVYTITTYNKKKGVKRIFHNPWSLAEAYNLIGWKTDRSLAGIIKRMEKQYPHIDITYTKNITVGPYMVYDIKTRKLTHTAKSFTELQEITGIKRNMVRDDLTLGNKCIYNKKFIIVPENRHPFSFEDYSPRVSTLQKVMLIDTKTNKKYRFHTITAMGVFLKVTKHTAIRIFKTCKEYKGYKIRPIKG